MKRDLHAGNWVISRERMKRKDGARAPHVVPLPRALLTTVCGRRDADGDGAEYTCHAPRDSSRPVTAEGVEEHYREALELGRKHSPHSWRSAFSTVCREAGKDSDAIEARSTLPWKQSR